MQRVIDDYVCLSRCYVKGVNVLCIGCQSAMFGCQTAMHRVTIDYDCLSNGYDCLSICYVTGDNLLCKGCQTAMIACQSAMHRVTNGYVWLSMCYVTGVKWLCIVCQSAMQRVSNCYASCVKQLCNGWQSKCFFYQKVGLFFLQFWIVIESEEGCSFLLPFVCDEHVAIV